MKKITLSLFLLIGSLQAHQLAPIEFGVYGGYQSDKLKYTVYNPNPQPEFLIFIQEKTKHTNGYRVGGFIETTPWNFYLFADGSYAHFNNQTYRVKNDFPNNPPLFIHGNYDTRTNGDLYQVAGEFGYRVQIISNKSWEWSVTPKVGYGYDHHVLKRTNTPTNVFSDLPLPAPALPVTMRIDFTEKLKWDWYGLYLGVKMTLVPVEQFIIDTQYSYHWLSAKQTQNETFFTTNGANIITLTLFSPSIMKTSHAHAHTFKLKLIWAITENWRIGAQGQYRYYWTGTRTVRSDQSFIITSPAGTTFLSDVSFGRERATWESYNALLEISYHM